MRVGKKCTRHDDSDGVIFLDACPHPITSLSMTSSHHAITVLKHLNMEAKAGYEAEKNAHKLNDIYAIKDRHER
jgi:hypothetical protein